MRSALHLEELQALEAEARTPDERRTVAAQLAVWAEETHPEDDEDVTPAALLAHAGELFVGFFAMREGLADVVKASITGSILVNLLLSLGAQLEQALPWADRVPEL